MSNKNQGGQRSQSNAAASQAVPQSTPEAAKNEAEATTVAGSVETQADADLEPVTISPEGVVEPIAAEAPAGPPPLRVFQVEIPNSLVGKQRHVAKDETEAYELYKQSCGMTSHARPQIVVELPAGSEGYEATARDWRNAREAEEVAKQKK